MHKHKSKVWNKYVRYLYRSGTSGSLANFGPWGNWDETSPARDRSSSLLPVHSPASTVLLWSSLLVYFHFLTVHEQKNGYQKAIFTMTAFLVSLERSCVESRILKSWGWLDGYSRMKSDREDNLKCRRSWVRRGLCFPLEGKKYFNFYPLFLLYYAVRETIGEVVYKYTQRDHTTLSAWSASRW